MSIPQPLTVNVNGDMTEADYKACSMVMGVCLNMVQKFITDAADKKKVPAKEALKNMDAWISGFVDFPFPFFTFKDTQSKNYRKDDFSLTADPDVVEQIVNIKGVDDLKKAVVSTLQKTKGTIVSYSKQDTDFYYFGVITGYNATKISLRVIKFEMHMKETDVEVMCSTTNKTVLDSSYDTYQFICDKELMIKMQEKIGEQMADYFAKKLLEFIEAFYDSQLIDYQSKLENIFR